MDAVFLLCSSFAMVFLLGVQQLNIAAGYRVAAFATSALIGTFTLLAMRLAPDAGFVEGVAFVIGGPFGIVGGPFGIVASMWVHPRLAERFHAWSHKSDEAAQ